VSKGIKTNRRKTNHVAETNRRKFNLENYIGNETVSPLTGYRGDQESIYYFLTPTTIVEATCI